MDIQLYGLQRSGTNFTRTLLQKRFNVKTVNNEKDRHSINHKHTRIYDDKRIIPEPKYLNDIYISSFDDFESKLEKKADFYIVISKDPYSWLISYKNWAAKCDWPVKDYHYIEEYNLFYSKWVELSKQTGKFIFIRYIDIVSDVDVFLNEIKKRLGLDDRFSFSFLIKRKFRRVQKSQWFSDERKNYYLNEEFLIRYKQDELDMIHNILDPDMMKVLGYNFIDNHYR